MYGAERRMTTSGRRSAKRKAGSSSDKSAGKGGRTGVYKQVGQVAAASNLPDASRQRQKRRASKRSNKMTTRNPINRKAKSWPTSLPPPPTVVTQTDLSGGCSIPRRYSFGRPLVVAAVPAAGAPHAVRGRGRRGGLASLLRSLVLVGARVRRRGGGLSGRMMVLRPVVEEGGRCRSGGACGGSSIGGGRGLRRGGGHRRRQGRVPWLEAHRYLLERGTTAAGGCMGGEHITSLV